MRGHPESFGRRLAPEEAVVHLWWSGSFTWEEVEIHGLEAQEAELRGFVDRVAPPPRWRLAADRVYRPTRRFQRRGRAWAARRLEAIFARPAGGNRRQ